MEGGDPSEVCHHVVHLGGIDGRVIPTHAVASLTDEPTDLPVSHAAHELIPRGLALGELDTCLSGVVEEFIVANPEGSVPGFVVCPAVHDRLSFVCCVCCRRCSAAPAVTVDSSPTVTLGTTAIIVLSGEIIIEVAVAHVVGIVGGLLSSAGSEGSEGEAVEVGFVVHALSMAGLEALWGKWWTP